MLITLIIVRLHNIYFFRTQSLYVLFNIIFIGQKDHSVLKAVYFNSVTISDNFIYLLVLRFFWGSFFFRLIVACHLLFLEF